MTSTAKAHRLQLAISGDYTFDLYDSIREAKAGFHTALDTQLESLSITSPLTLIVAHPMIHSPAMVDPNAPPLKDSEKYSRDKTEVSLVYTIPYTDWVAGTLADRQRLFAEALKARIQQIREKSLSAEDRAGVIACISAAHAAVAVAPGMEGAAIAVTTAAAPTVPARDALPFRTLYKRTPEAWLYHEAWVSDTQLTQHWGTVGSRGESVIHAVANGETAPQAVERILRAARKEGFTAVPEDEYTSVIGEYALNPTQHADAIDQRHKIEDALGTILGWTGLGWCDGGSTSADAMEVVCIVVDADIALAVLEKANHVKHFGVAIEFRRND